MAAIGVYAVRPHADLSFDETLLRQTGEVKLLAAPGMGYSYQWDGLVSKASTATAEPKYEAKREQRIVVAAGETREVVLRVKNAFGLESERRVTLVRKAIPGARVAAPAAPAARAPGAAAPAAPAAPAPAGAPARPAGGSQQPGHEGHDHD